jgi:hypothetical protein
MVRVWLSFMQPWRAAREHERLQIRITVDPTTNQSYVAPPAPPAWGTKPVPEFNYDSRWYVSDHDHHFAIITTL